MLSHIAYVDESVRGQSYLLGVAIVPTARRAALDRLVRSLCLPGQRSVHMKDESKPRAKQIITAIVGAECPRAWIYRTRQPGVLARERCLRALVADLIEAGVGHLVLDRVDERQVVRDRQTIVKVVIKRSAEMLYEHAESRQHSGPQVADVVAWAHGAGEDWKRRISPMVARVVEV